MPQASNYEALDARHPIALDDEVLEANLARWLIANPPVNYGADDDANNGNGWQDIPANREDGGCDEPDLDGPDYDFDGAANDHFLGSN